MKDTLPTEPKFNWQEQIQKLVMPITAVIQMQKAFSPFYLMYRRHPMLTIDIQFGV